MSILSFRWDLWALWATCNISMRAYLVALIGLTVRVIWMLSRNSIALSRACRNTDLQVVKAKVFSELFGLDQLVTLFRLIFGMVLADGVFGAFRSVELSRETGLSELHLDVALWPLASLSFAVLGTFVAFHTLMWVVRSKAQRVWPLR